MLTGGRITVGYDGCSLILDALRKGLSSTEKKDQQKALSIAICCILEQAVFGMVDQVPLPAKALPSEVG